MVKKNTARTVRTTTPKRKGLQCPKNPEPRLYVFFIPFLLIILGFFKVGHFSSYLIQSILAFLVSSSRTGIVVAVLLITLYSIFLLKLSVQLPSPSAFSPTNRPLTTQIYDREGKLLYQIYEGRNRSLIKLDELPPFLIQATIAIEDKHFYSHHGLDMEGIVRALRYNLTEEAKSNGWQGGSTITQQLIKNTLLTPEKTVTRKVKEVLLSLWAEAIFDKKEILQMYFNEAPYGGPAWGVEEAAKMYFGKSAQDLNLSEAAYLAGLPAAPTFFSPYGTHPEEGLKRQKEVLRRMVEDGFISRSEAEQATEVKLTFRPPATPIKAPHFVMYVRSLLATKYGEKVVSQGGLKVTTSLDLEVQEMAEEVVAKEVAQLQKLQVGNGAAMVMDSKTGQILAMVGSKDYFDPNGGNYNAALALRPPGSSIKVVTYTAAFKQGFSPGTILLDTPTAFPDGLRSYTPVNYDGRFHGPVTLRTALGSSYNVPAVKTLAMVGLPAMVQTAKEMGITTFNNPENYGLSLTLGGGGVKMLDMMTVYGTLASGGVRIDPQAILKVTDAEGNILEEITDQIQGKRVLTEEVTYLMSHILSDKRARAPAFGTNSLLEIPGHPSVAVKTGTSDYKKDNWTFGYTPELVVGAWVGNFDNSPMHPTLSSGITGATPIWHNIIVNLLEGQPDLAFQKPQGIIETEVGGRRDLTISGQVPKTVVFSKKAKKPKKDQEKEEETISFTDQFSTFIPQPSQTVQ